MGKKPVFEATKQMTAFYSGFFKDVAQEIGLEKSVELLGNQSKPFGAAVAGMLKQELGNRKINYAAFESVYSRLRGALGFQDEYKKNRAGLKVTTGRCPFYEGFASAGLDHKSIEMICSRTAAVEYEEIKKAYPQFSGCLKFRSAPDQPCLEEFVILK